MAFNCFYECPGDLSSFFRIPKILMITDVKGVLRCVDNKTNKLLQKSQILFS